MIFLGFIPAEDGSCHGLLRAVFIDVADGFRDVAYPETDISPKRVDRSGGHGKSILVVEDIAFVVLFPGADRVFQIEHLNLPVRGRKEGDRDLVADSDDQILCCGGRRCSLHAVDADFVVAVLPAVQR